MKITIEIPDTLWQEAQKLATREQITFNALVVKGLRRILAERRNMKSFQLRKATFRGQGLQPHLADASWEHIREMAYRGRGDN